MNDADLTLPLEKPIPATLRKAIVWGKGQILTEAVAFLLRTQPTLEIIKFFDDATVDDLIEQAARSHPDVIILCQEKDEMDTTILFPLFEMRTDLKIIVLSLENNMMQIYNKHNFFMRDVSDLLTVVESNQDT